MNVQPQQGRPPLGWPRQATLAHPYQTDFQQLEPWRHSKPNLRKQSSNTYIDGRKRNFHNGQIMSTAKRLKEARIAAGFTQVQVAKAFSISREAVSLWESE